MGGWGGIVKREVVVVEEIGVVWLEEGWVVDCEGRFWVMVKIGDGIDGGVKVWVGVEVGGDLKGVWREKVVWERDGVEVEGIGVVNVEVMGGG